MSATPNTRNINLIRNVLLEELIEQYVDLWIQHEEPDVLHTVLRSRTYQQRIAGRLGITMPDTRDIVGRIVSIAYIRSVRSRKELAK